jgi:hypothetical protein
MFNSWYLRILYFNTKLLFCHVLVSKYWGRRDKILDSHNPITKINLSVYEFVSKKKFNEDIFFFFKHARKGRLGSWCFFF